MSDYQSTIFDREWTRDTLGKIKDGGIWLVPMTASGIRVYHDLKQFKFVIGDTSLETNQRIIKVMTEIGYSQILTKADIEKGGGPKIQRRLFDE